MELGTGFYALTEDEMQLVEGGDPYTTALAIVGYFAGCAVAGWNAGRQVVRDVKNKFFD